MSNARELELVLIIVVLFGYSVVMTNLYWGLKKEVKERGENSRIAGSYRNVQTIDCKGRDI